MEIVILNSLPFSGKDTLVKKVLEHNKDYVHLRFKNPLYREFAKRYGLDFDKVVEICNGEQKDRPHDLIDGAVPRQVLIDISENYIKVERGPTGVAQFVIDDILDTENFNRKKFIFSDGGFEDEVIFLKRVLKRYGLTSLKVIRIERAAVADKGVKDSRRVFENPDYIFTNDIDEVGDEIGTNLYSQFVANIK